ncbi:MAG TPA: zinc-dependent alcohol dehydrogenase [Gaiellaceae bacterium]|nr:zinc-dependent alcohol dehydrogenase [Gaiellaceae bacterium]
MKAVVWHGPEDVRVDDVPDPRIEEPTDAIVRITSTAICGSDLHLYGVIGRPLMRSGDILGHEPMGIVEQVGSEVDGLRVGDRVVVPFNISCGRCRLCGQGLQSQCETTQNRKWKKGASLFGYTHLYGGVAGGQAEYLRVPMAHYGPIVVPEGPPDERFLLLSDVLPTAWQAVEYAQVPAGGTLGVFGLGPIGQMCCRIARHRGAGRVIGVDLVPERLALAQRHGAETVDLRGVDDVVGLLRELTNGLGLDSAIDAVGMEADAGPLQRLLQKLKVVPDRFGALLAAVRSLKRGGTLSISGVYMGAFPLVPLGELFDRQLTIRMGQANVRRWVDEIMPLLGDGDPLGTQDFVTHDLPLGQAPEGYRMFREKRDGAIKVVLHP